MRTQATLTGFEPVLPDRQSGVLASTLQSHIFQSTLSRQGRIGSPLRSGRRKTGVPRTPCALQCSPCGFRFYRPVRSPLRYLPLVMIGQAIIIDFHFSNPFFPKYCLQLPFLSACLYGQICYLIFKSTIRVTIPLHQFGRLVAVSPPHFVRRTVVHPITPIVHSGREVPVFCSPYKVLMYCSVRCYRR